MSSAKPIYFRYGSYAHAIGECQVKESKEARFSEDGTKALYTACRWDILGTLVRDSQAEITKAVNAMRQAYSQSGRDAGLYFQGGGATAVFVRSNNTISGVRVSRPPQFPDASGGQYSTFLNFAIALEWEESADAGFVSRRQSIEYEGDGGPDWDMVTPTIGKPLASQRTEMTFVVVRQTGIALSCGGIYQVPSDPIWESVPPRVPNAGRIGYREVNGLGDRETFWSYVFKFSTHPGIVRP